MQKILLILITVLLSLSGFSQTRKREKQEEKRNHKNSLIRQEEEGVIAYKKSLIFGAKLTNDGYGVFFELGKASSVKKSMLYQLEIAERKSTKEEKLSNLIYNSSPFVYGKINYFYPVKLGVQQQILLGNKSNKNGVSITGNYGGGISAALLRPYYIQVAQGNQLVFIKYNSADSTQFLNPNNIYGGPTFSKGWSDVTVTPGVYGKAALRFDYGAYNEVVSAIEIGITGEYYSKKIPQMVYNKEKQFFFGAYFSLLFGRRK
ncbi:MAG: hypothetical protein ABI168_07525 [Ginsengibacter sp.]